MSITSLSFLWFLLTVILFYYVLPFSNWKKVILLLASVFFYCSYNPFDFLYLFCIILYTYILGCILEFKRNRFTLSAGILPVLAELIYYTYANQFLGFVNHYHQIAAPLGISFFTFKSIGYLIDVYRQNVSSERNFLNLAVYLSFFPQISSGPIQKSSSFLSNLNKVKCFDYSLVRHGFLLMFFGTFEKIVISERLYLVVENCFSDLSVLTPSIALIGVIAYSFQIYADFDAYSNIAIGLGELFGIECERNFFVPYLSRNIKEFWERWHISLSSWLKEYVYFPLGGSRKGTLRKYINVCIVFLVSGLWHGSTLNFLLWGLLNGILRVFYDILDKSIFSKFHLSFPVLKCVNLIQIVLNFCVVTLLWVVFRFHQIADIRIIFSMLAQLDFSMFSFEIPGMLMQEFMVTVIFTIFLIIADVLRNSGFTLTHFGKLIFPVRWIVYVCMIVFGLLFAMYGPGYDPSKFIYIEF